MALRELLAEVAQNVANKFGGGHGEAQKPPDIQDGNAAPSNARLTPNQQKYGPNYERLKELAPDIVNALQRCILEYRLEATWTQRRRVGRTQRARDFWNGIHYGNDWWTATSTVNGPIASALDEEAEETGPRFEYVTNWFQGYGLSFCALMAQDTPSTTFAPRSRDSQEDITFAKAADDVVDLEERNNSPKKLLVDAARYCWTDGIVAGYVRYVVDGERFGYDELPKLALGNVGGFQVPVDGGTEKIPRGQEVITIVGGLEAVIPIWADDTAVGARLSPECPYLQWNTESHIARLKAGYPHAADQIQADWDLGADAVYERVARMGVKQQLSYLLPSDAMALLSTFSRTWLRKWAFQKLEDKAMVARLEDLFPEGAYVAFAGLTYCESRSEGVDQRWRVMHALPGDGQWHPPAGEALISPQERYNDFSNLQTENILYGVPPIYGDPGTVDFDKLAAQAAEPATMYPAKARPGMSLGDSFYQPEPAKEPATLGAVMTELAGPTMQFLAGLPPAIWGGEMADVKTASGYAQARDQAMGRLGLIRLKVREFYNELMFLAVQCFRENRPQDVEIPFAGESGEEKARWIRLGDLNGNIMVEPEADDGLPRLKSQQRDVLTALFGMGPGMPPMVQKVLSEPANIGWMKDVLGLTELDDPDEDARTLMMRRIQMLLDSVPIQPPGMSPMPTPDGRIAMVPPQPIASLPLNDVFDLPIAPVLLAECFRWANSEPGQTAAKENPAGYQNVYLYAKQLVAMMQAQKAQQAQTQPPKPPALSMKVEDMPPVAAAQALAQDNIQVTPEELQARQEQNRADKAAELSARLAAGKGPGSASGSPTPAPVQ